MLTPGERLRAVTGGALGLAGIVLFAALGVSALLGTGLGNPFAALTDAYIQRVLHFTLLQALLSALLSVLPAILFARALARQPSFPGRVWIIRLMGVPLGLPVITGALGLITVWGRNGWANELLSRLGLAEPVSIYGLQGILLAHVFFNFPLASRLLLASVERLPAEYWLIAGNLGMRPGAVFRLIEWPALRRQLPGLFGLIFMLAATSFTLVLLLGGGPAATTLEVAIYQALRFDFDPPRAVVLSLLQIGVTAILLLLLALLPTAMAEGATTGIGPRRPDGKGAMRRLADAVPLGIGTLFVALPLASVVISGLRADLIRLATDPMVHRALVTSLAIAIPAGLLSVLMAVLLVNARLALLASAEPSRTAKTFAASLTPAASLILLVPPTVLGTGWFLRAGPAAIGMLAPVLIAGINGLMALPFVLRVVEPALQVHRSRSARLAVSLGISGWKRLRQVDWPALRRPLAMALAFGTALSLGDLGVVALFGSDDLVTLPWLLYGRMGSYRTADAAGLALFLALLCLALTLAGTAKAEKDIPA